MEKKQVIQVIEGDVGIHLTTAGTSYTLDTKLGHDDRFGHLGDLGLQIPEILLG